MIAILKYWHKLIWRTLCLLLCCSFFGMSFASGLEDKCPRSEVSKQAPAALNFIPDDSSCGGHFSPEPKLKYQEGINFAADTSNINAKTGISSLQGNTQVTYKDASLLADQVCLSRDTAFVKGNVKFAHNQAVVFADSILWDIKNEASLQGAAFQIPMPNTNLKTAWGYAEGATISEGVIDLVNSSYNICSPNNPIWSLDAGTLTIDRQAHQGYATNVLFRLYSAPVFYLPVLYFPLGKGRYSGFLYPKIGYSNTGKITMKIPYYFNLAPNYDAIIAASYYGGRGFAWQASTRFLTATSSGSLYFMQWPHDKEFSSFKADFGATFATDTSVVALTESLSSASNNRRFFYYQQSYKPSDALTLDLKYAWLSDDYMRSDFDEVRELLPTRKAPRSLKAILDHENIFVNFTWAQDKVLQPLGKTVLKGLFFAEPELYVKHHIYNDSGFSFKQQLHFLMFEPATDIGLSTTFDIDGTRISYEPQVEYASHSYGRSLQAILGAHVLGYDWEDLANGAHKSDNIFIPWLSVDQKWHLTNGKQFFMTPRLLFKYAPYRDQSSLPLIDAGYKVANYVKLFSINRFSGMDRFGDTTSFVFGLENKIVSPETGLVKATLNVGKSYDFQLHKTCLGSSCLLDNQSYQHWSDWVVAASLLNDDFNWALDLAMDNKLQKTNDFYLSLQYNQSSKLYYHYAKLLNTYDDTLWTNKVVGAEHEAAMNKNWSIFGNFEYDTSGNNFFNYMAGFKYKSCCLDLKLGLQRHYSGTDGYSKAAYKNSIVFEFALPGLGVHS